MLNVDKLQLIALLYEHVIDNTASFEEDHIGADLAYLFGAIATGGVCEWPEGRRILTLLAGASAPVRKAVGKYIVIGRQGNGGQS